MDSKAWPKQLSPEARSVLDVGLGVSAPAGTKQAVWSALAVKLPATTAAGALAGGVTSVSVLKALAVGLALGAGTATGIVGVRSVTEDAAPSVPTLARRVSGAPPAPPRALPTPTPAPAAKQEGLTVAPLVPALSAKQALPSEAATDPAPASSASSAVASFPAEATIPRLENAVVVESRRLAEVRVALQARDARTALARLNQLDRDFPRGVLIQERDALRIESFVVLGDRERARELAQRFLEQHPRSPHAAAAERALR
jgi:hypothetical protein